MLHATAGLLFDNDILSVLAAVDLVEEVIAILGVDAAHVYRLDSLTHMLRRGTRIGAGWDERYRAQAQIASERITVWREQPAAELLQQFRDVPDVDAGEAGLFASLVEHPLYLLASGDKRAMRAICQEPMLRTIRDAVAGRVICFESVLGALVDRYGHVQIGSAFAPVRAHHGTLKLVFTDHILSLAEPDQCRFAISSMLRDHLAAVGDGFLREI